MKKKHVIFDFDGTITDSFGPGSQVLLAAAERAGLPSGKDILSAIAENYGAPTSALLEQCWPGQNKELFYAALKEFNDKEHTPLFAGTISALDAIKGAGVGMSIYTGRQSIGTLPVLDFFKIKNYFSFIVCREDVKKGKPDPEGLNKIIASLAGAGLNKEEIIFVGDSRADLECAKNAGIEFVAVAESENTSVEKFIACGVAAKNIIPSLRALPNFLEIK
jgi:HAD superfamily hydrolase (TIGR01549 family)